MARRSRTSVLKRQREAKKRLREKRKAEKAALKRERRHGKKDGPGIATRDELVDIGVLPPLPKGSDEDSDKDSDKDSDEDSDEDSDKDSGDQ